ncbi:hypothetical protein EZL74_10965 [Flavobacterium silvisoli]|uniref:asparagine synthase (glutamine-hydrolyzing) n=1 Tax=Flavobacterium silvisoli TaxID=2529433 RepID=A0A4Q9YS02_9FLAO|nr:hypothetical protein [Flavobacterium silvisoli]TBX66362.1 hypothetical protein EZL74_10965 [Flavobacterium silvisoli]
MHIWILKYGASSFSDDFLSEANNITQQISQLHLKEIYQKKFGNFHLVSFCTKFEKSQKRYLQSDDENLKGYSGLLIGKNTTDVDYRDIKNIDCNTPEEYNGQYALFQLNKDQFVCSGDNFGFHKVFYFQKGNEIYVTNYLKLLQATKAITANPEQVLSDFLTSRFGVFPGYNTLFKEVFTLPEYGMLTIQEGVMKVASYKDVNELLVPANNFEHNIQKTAFEYKNAALYLRNFHKTAIGVSGGFDGRLMLSFFYNTQGKSLETYTYNRAGKLDLWIASYLSRKFRVPHKKFELEIKLNDFTPVLNEFKDSKGDAFTNALDQSVGRFFETDDSFKVSLGGNGADTDWEFGEKKLKYLKTENFKSFISSYALMLVTHPLVSEKVTQQLADRIEYYLYNKYKVFESKENYIQLLASAFFHLERFRGEQGFVYSQRGNVNKDIFAPFAIESFNQCVFSATKNQLQRTLKEGIHFRLYYELTEGKVPYAPILTARNEFGKNLFQKALNYIAPTLPKLIWKLFGGDTNQRIRKKYAKNTNDLSKDYLMKNHESALWQYLDYATLQKGLNDGYNGQYNTIATMVKFIENNTQ